uniref:Uncharacterized protein n=1 Tax=Panagrolaimus sp. ES5 TaxID=591445 RepID=A0AC34FUV9_9BILA
MVLCCVIIFTIKKTRKTSSSNLYVSPSEMPSHILMHAPSKSNRKNKSASMKIKLLGKRDIRSTVQDQHYPISTKKRTYWEHSLDYTNPYNPYSKSRPYFSESNYSA